MNTDVPKIFISYSWSNDKHIERVVELAQRLKNHGVEVIFDKWRLKEGQDKYAFMEQCVTDKTVIKVLIICDKIYAEKADAREGGVGDETVVISSEVYGKVNQEKFLPIIFERDENGNEYRPTYLKSRIYLDFSDNENYEQNYDKLLRNIYNKPEHSEPPLGKMPEWLNEETISFTPIRATMNQIQANDGKNKTKLRYLIQQFNDNFIATLVEFIPQYDDNIANNLLKQIDVVKPLRDLFFDYIEIIIMNEYDIDAVLGNFFEQCYNGLYIQKKVCNSYSESEFEFGFFMIWELFIGTTAILLHHKCYKELNAILNRTYFLKENHYSDSEQPNNFIKFRPYLRCIEVTINQSRETRKFTLAGDILSKREKLPVLTTRTIANADIVLYQLSDALDIKGGWGAWFPMLYVYFGGSRYGAKQDIWSKMVSKRHCESLFPLFGVHSIKELTIAVEKNRADANSRIRHSGSFDYAPIIQDSIVIQDIATLP